MIEFEMYTPEGNQACNEALENIKAIINGDRFIPEREFWKISETEIKKVASVHREVYDTEPRWHFERLLNKALEERGYGYKADL
jgi:hypothetical protein